MLTLFHEYMECMLVKWIYTLELVAGIPQCSPILVLGIKNMPWKLILQPYRSRYYGATLSCIQHKLNH